MCYYNGVKVTKAEYIRLKQLERAIANLNLNRPMQIGFNYGTTPVLKRSDDYNFEVVEMEWGFLPDKWFGRPIDTREKAKRFRNGFPDLLGNMKPGITTLNAMAEELFLPGKIYTESALLRRCLVVSTGFYEWRHIYRKNKRTGEPLKSPDKYPYHIMVKDEPYFLMAGIYKPWTDQETGETVDTLSVITTKANSLMMQVHNSKERMPTILNQDLAYSWLFDDLTQEQISEIAKYQYPAEQMEAYTIAKDFREAIDPTAAFQYEELPPLELVA